MRQFFKILIYLLLMPIVLWLAYAGFAYLVAFSYSGHHFSWIPFYILGGWVPGKWYGLTLWHSILCVFLSFLIIGVFDHLIGLGNKSRLVILLLVSLFFSYEAIFNFFFQNVQEALIPQYRQFALLQCSFLIGILIKAFNKNAEMN